MARVAPQTKRAAPRGAALGNLRSEKAYLSIFRPPSAAHFSSIFVVTDFGRSIA